MINQEECLIEYLYTVLNLPHNLLGRKLSKPPVVMLTTEAQSDYFSTAFPTSSADIRDY
jgi:hypothetical protein